jgi:AcrR family transcriptional regulator
MTSACAATEDTPTRQRILDAALELFARQGYAATSVRELARAVGLRESSLYNHFAGKEAILHALVGAWGPANWAERLRGPRYRALKDNPAGFCATYAADLLELWCDPREQKFQEMLLAERNLLPAERAHYLDTLFADEAALVADRFREFQLAGRITAPNPSETARLFMAGLTYIRLEHFIMPPSPSPRTLVGEALVRFLGNFLALVGASGQPKGAAGRTQ